MENSELINKYTTMVNLKTKKTTKVCKIILFTYLIVMLLFAIIFPHIPISSTYYLPFFIIGILILICLLSSYLYKSEKPYREFLLMEIINNINKTTIQSLIYSAYPKEKIKINSTGGLFTHYATEYIKSSIKTSDFIFYDIKMFTSDGKNQITQFEGMYFIIDYKCNQNFQIRSHYKPKLKGKKFKCISKDNSLKVFVEETYDILENTSFIDLVNFMQEKLNTKKIYLALQDNKLHFAFESSLKFNKPKRIDSIFIEDTQSKLNTIISIPSQITKFLSN